MIIDAQNLSYSQINTLLKEHGGNIQIQNCLGHRFLAAGLSEGNISIY